MLIKRSENESVDIHKNQACLLLPSDKSWQEKLQIIWANKLITKPEFQNYKAVKIFRCSGELQSSLLACDA